MVLALRQNPLDIFNRMPLLKKLFWLYFLLLIFEGALRKWIVPQLSAPLLLVRDPVALWIIVWRLIAQTNCRKSGLLLRAFLPLACSDFVHCR